MTRSLANIHRESFLHRLDARVKLLTTLLFILLLSIVGQPSWLLFGAYLLLLAALILLSHLPPVYLLKRSLLVLPLVLVVAMFLPFMRAGDVVAAWQIWHWHVTITQQGLAAFGTVMVRAWLSMLALVLLTATTSVNGLLESVQQLRLPGIMVTTLSFMYRYIDVLEDEFTRMRQARDSRYFAGGWLWQLRTIGNMIGTLFIRSYERGERVYAAMVSRGFTGKMPARQNLRLKKGDWLFTAGIVVYLIGTWLLLGGV